MKVEDVKSYKQIYKNIHVPFSVAEEKWHAQRDLLGEQDTPRPAYYRYMPYAYAVAGIVLFLSVSLLTVLAAQPGTSLYGMKAMTKQVYSHLTGELAPQKHVSSIQSSVSKSVPTSLPTKNFSFPTVTSHPTTNEEMHESSSAVAHEHENEVKGAAITSMPHTFSSNHNSSDNHGSQSNQSQNHGSGSQNSHDNSDNSHSDSHGGDH